MQFTFRLSLLRYMTPEGQLIGAPEMARTTGFNTKSVRLPSLTVELWQGPIFATLDSSAQHLACRGWAGLTRRVRTIDFGH